VHDQHVDRRTAGHVGGDRAEEPALEAVEPAVAHDEQVGLLASSSVSTGEPTTASG
jgi:hypothetical protein